MNCGESRRLHAYLDDELDAASRAEMQRHVESCKRCSAEFDDLLALREQLRGSLPLLTAPARLRTRIEHALDAATGATSTTPQTGVQNAWRLPSFWWGAASGVGVAIPSMAVVLLLLTTRIDTPLFDDMLAAHLQSLQSGQLTAVVSTDRHTVKPWFAGRAEVSPAVADFSAEGYRLLGGRIEHIAQQRAAVMVYQHGPHFINVFSWAAQHPWSPSDVTRKGYHIACWRTADLNYCALSDTGWDELLGLEHLLREVAEREQQAGHR